MVHCLRSLIYLTFALTACAVLPLTGVVKAQPPQPQPFLTYYMPGSKDPLPSSTFGKIPSHVPAPQTTFALRVPQSLFLEPAPAPVSPASNGGLNFNGINGGGLNGGGVNGFGGGI
jgi:hypothetical protein